MSDDRLIPESMVKLLFDQVKDSADKNTQAVKEFSAVVRELGQMVGQQPTRTELMTALKEHDQECAKRGSDVYDIIEKEDTILGTKVNGATSKVETASKNIDDAVKSLGEIKKLLEDGNTDIRDLKSSVKTMITVVLIVSALLTTAFYFVKSASDTSINTAVKSAVNDAVKEIITTRPSNVWPIPEDKKK
jgi:uncharacterized protein YgfB (UPF0149 family)